MRSAYPIADLPSSSAFLRGYSRPPGANAAACFESVAGWYHYNPHDPQAVAARLAELDARGSPAAADRQRVSAAIAAQQQRWAAQAGIERPRALAAARSLAEPGVYAVVTGQQTGLFGGPLYTQLKAASTISLARSLAAAHPGRTFVPLFWMASGDNDFEEVRRAHALGRGGEPFELALPPEPSGDAGRSIAARDCSAGIAAALDTLEEQLAGGELREEVVATLRACYSTGSLVAGFAAFMSRLFADSELLVIDPQDAALMRSAAPVLQNEILRADEFEAALNARNGQISLAGFSPQADSAPGDTNLFLLDDDGRRRKLARDGSGGFTLRGGSERFTVNELAALAESAPERFVCGVLARPVYQDTLIPPVAFIGGGSEIAYRAQVTALFDLHGQKMAPAFHRASATLLPEKSAALLDELGWELTDLCATPQDVAGRLAQLTRPAGIDAALELYLERVHSADAELKALAVALEPTLEASFDTLRGNMISHIDKLEKKISSVLKQQDSARQRRALLAAQQAWPQGKPQERGLSILSFLPRTGFALGPRLIAELPMPSWEHRVLLV